MTIPVKTDGGGYNIFLERGALGKAGEYFNLNRRALIVTDSGVPEEYPAAAAEQCGKPFLVTVPEGEPSKCFDTYKLLLKELVKNGFTRSDCVIAVGGGVVGDMAGFAAASYMRGIDFYNIPTTVLSQVDSSVGGKVAIDFEGYKNIVGAFYPPSGVIIDPDTLSTLPERQISNGLAEALKMSMTSDEELFGIFENKDINGNIDVIIERSVKIKRAVVERDEKESGLRKILNFGHTIAHAIESQNDMRGLYHGECVAVGMIPMCSEPVRKRLIPILKRLRLPTGTEIDSDRLINAMRHDKKMAGDEITVIYVPQIGSYEMKTMPFEQFAGEIKEIFR